MIPNQGSTNFHNNTMIDSLEKWYSLPTHLENFLEQVILLFLLLMTVAMWNCLVIPSPTDSHLTIDFCNKKFSSCFR